MCRIADGEELLDESGHAAVLLEEFTSIRSAQKAKQAQIKGMHAQVQSVLQSSEAARTSAGPAPAAPGPLPHVASATGSVRDSDGGGDGGGAAVSRKRQSEGSGGVADAAPAAGGGRVGPGPASDRASCGSSHSGTLAAGNLGQEDVTLRAQGSGGAPAAFEPPVRPGLPHC